MSEQTSACEECGSTLHGTELHEWIGGDDLDRREALLDSLRTYDNKTGRGKG